MTIHENDPHDIRRYLEDWSEDLDLLLQNNLLNEGTFIRFARDRGIAVSGVIEGDPGEFNRRGWLPHDGLQANGEYLFHPFRGYPLHRILQNCKLSIAASSSLDREGFSEFVRRVAEEGMPRLDAIGEAAAGWNRATDLAILLEPLFWPEITGHYKRPAFVTEDAFTSRLDAYRQRALDLVARLDPDEWRKHHESLRIHAARTDDNGALYLMLRSSKWSRREKIKGSISCALWTRHMAEIIRRGFESVHGNQWPEEDQAFGNWRPGGRTVAYGSERPLDDVDESRPRLAFYFGLSTGSAIRWYVEGDTEYYAILSVLEKPATAGIELVNLRGNIATNRDNIAFKLRDSLVEDLALRRFSMLSFDVDVPENVKIVRRQVENGNVVGYIAAHRPDFEFANFTLLELVEVAALLDERYGVSGACLRTGDFSHVTSGRGFEERYRELSSRQPRGLKGEEWGRILATYAGINPKRGDDNTERPFWREIRAALQGRIAHYDLQREHFRFDLGTFELVDCRKR